MYDAKEIETINKKYPDRIPVILGVTINFGKKYSLKKNKYIVNKETTIGNFTLFLCRQININSGDTIYLMIDNKLLPSFFTFEQVDNKFVSPLLIQLDCESAFG